jgi:hypothetical protein
VNQEPDDGSRQFEGVETLESRLLIPKAGHIGSASAVITSCQERHCEVTPLKYQKLATFPLTRAASLLFYESREKAGPVPSAESVFFSGPVSQFSAVDDC